MNRFTKKMLVFSLLLSVVVDAWADRGIGKKNKNKTILNIVSPNSDIKHAIAFNLKSGLTYKGSLLTNNKTLVNSAIVSTSIVTYQKGNTTYIIPYKNKITVTEVGKGYTGMKIIIRKK